MTEEEYRELAELWESRCHEVENYSLDLVNVLAPFCQWYSDNRVNALTRRQTQKEVTWRWNKAVLIMTKILKAISKYDPDVMSSGEIDRLKTHNYQT